MSKTDFRGVSKVILTKGKDVILIKKTTRGWVIPDSVSEVRLSGDKLPEYVDFYKSAGYKITVNKDKKSLKAQIKQKTSEIKSKLVAVTKKRRGYTVPARSQVYWVKKK